MDYIIKQIKDNDGYKEIPFSIYGFIEDDGFVAELDAFFNEKTDKSDYIYKLIDLDEKDKKNILIRNKNSIKKILTIKQQIENISDNKTSMIKVYLKKDKGVVFIVKYKDFNF